MMLIASLLVALAAGLECEYVDGVCMTKIAADMLTDNTANGECVAIGDDEDACKAKTYGDGKNCVYVGETNNNGVIMFCVSEAFDNYFKSQDFKDITECPAKAQGDCTGKCMWNSVVCSVDPAKTGAAECAKKKENECSSAAAIGVSILALLSLFLL